MLPVDSLADITSKVNPVMPRAMAMRTLSLHVQLLPVREKTGGCSQRPLPKESALLFPFAGFAVFVEIFRL